jgi:uncharacterized alkaline shock family protein YloU
MAFLLGLGAAILLGTAGLVTLIAGWGPPGWAVNTTTWAGRVVLSLIGVASLSGAVLFGQRLIQRLAEGRAMRRPGPKGDILIAPQAVKQLAAGVLQRELGLTGFRIRLEQGEEGLILTVGLPLPSGEEAPSLAERLQALLTSEIQAKTGLPVAEVNLVIHGTARPAPPPEGTE